jgi:glycosyltransferase involved in cell wall biosynthesis
MRVLITHDFFETYGGAERVTAEIAAAFPDARVHAILGRQAVAERMGIAERVSALLPETPQLLAHYRKLAPAYPALVRRARLPEADLVICSSYAYAHGFETENHAPKLCYCHGPFRHLWSQQAAYAARLPGGRAGQVAFGAYAALARHADRTAAHSVDRFLTQSRFTAELIAAAYGRLSDIVGAPVDCERFVPGGEPDDYFLFAGRLVETYKRPSLAVDAFAQLPDHRLVVVGDGPALPQLRGRAADNVTFLGALDDDGLLEVMQRCRALIFPSVDDFGLAPLEANACGRPVLAVRAGGPRHTVVPGVTGEFLEAQTAAAIVGAVRAFDDARYDGATIRRHALRWDKRMFRRQIRAAARELLSDADPRPARQLPRPAFHRAAAVRV